MIRAVLVDDEPPARVRMRQLLDAVGGVTIVGEAGSGVEALELIAGTRPDLLFLDVDMPEMRGTALAAALPEPRPFIVFATAFDSYGLDAIAVEATDYLLKPVSRAKLSATLDRVRARLGRLNVERDVAAATVVQSRLWPATLPHVPGFDCAAATLAARGVGGDFYDVFAIAHTGAQGAHSAQGATRVLGAHGATGAYGILLGDVSGKGVAAGLVASAVQARVNAAARHGRLDPEALIAAVDRDVYASTDGARYATAIYAELDAATSRMTVVNAGHPAALVVPGRRTLTATGPALGLIEAGAFGSHSLTVRPGTVFVAYTDGVTEALNGRSDEFGESQLLDIVERRCAEPAADICAAVIEAVRSHRGGAQDQDDVTLMVIKGLA